MRRLKRGGRPGGSNLTVAFSVERCCEKCGHEEELELEIGGNVTPYDPGFTSGLPENCYPPEGGESEIESITLDGKGWDGDLTKKERSAVGELLREAAQDAYESAMESAAEDRAESRAYDERYGYD